MICTHNGYKDSSGNLVPRIDIDEYPSLKSWFNNGSWNKTPDKTSNLDRLKIRTDKGDTPYNLRDCAYMDDFAKQKIVFSRISGNSPCFAMDKSGMLTNDTGYIITGKGLPYLLSQLTSREIWYVFKRFYMGGGIEREFKVNNLQTLRVPPANQAIPFTEREINFISSSVKA